MIVIFRGGGSLPERRPSRRWRLGLRGCQPGGTADDEALGGLAYQQTGGLAMNVTAIARKSAAIDPARSNLAAAIRAPSRRKPKCKSQNGNRSRPRINRPGGGEGQRSHQGRRAGQRAAHSRGHARGECRGRAAVALAAAAARSKMRRMNSRARGGRWRCSKAIASPAMRSRSAAEIDICICSSPFRSRKWLSNERGSLSLNCAKPGES